MLFWKFIQGNIAIIFLPPNSNVRLPRSSFERHWAGCWWNWNETYQRDVSEWRTQWLRPCHICDVKLVGPIFYPSFDTIKEIRCCLECTQKARVLRPNVEHSTSIEVLVEAKHVSLFCVCGFFIYLKGTQPLHGNRYSLIHITRLHAKNSIHSMAESVLPTQTIYNKKFKKKTNTVYLECIFPIISK